MMELFQAYKFKSHAGLDLTWKIECDALSDSEWAVLADMIMEFEPRPFKSVAGIPRGGIKLAEALQRYATGEPRHNTLIVDDVLTTGQSISDFTQETYNINYLDKDLMCWVVFSRKDVPGVNALFRMPK